MKRYIYLPILVLLFIACDDQIEADLTEIDPIIVIDAWLDDTGSGQIISVKRSQQYFDSSPLEGVEDAVVTITDDDGNTYPFTHTGRGEYLMVTGSETFAEIERVYNLSVVTPEGSFFSQSTMNRVPEIDSITFRFEEEQAPFIPDSYFAEVWARDPEGTGDTYWIKTWKNGNILDEPVEISIAYDAGFSAGGNVDGLIFIQPIRDSVNPFDTDRSESSEFDLLPPYLFGDSIYVEIHSISNEAFFFFQRVQVESGRTGGFAELFATPLANVPTNIISENENTLVLGFFNVASVTGLGRTLVDESDVREVPE